MILFIRSSLIQRDVRAQKYIHFLDKNKVKLVQWDRANEFHGPDKGIITYRLDAGFGQRLKSMFKFFQWNLFLLKTLFKERKNYKVIQICDLDSFFAVLPFRLIGKKVIFDVYDFFTDSKISNTNSMAYSVLYNLEMFCLKFVDLLILPLDARKKHLNFFPEKMFVCENVPLIEKPEEIEIYPDENKLNIIYAGTLEAKHRGLEWIPELAKDLGKSVHFYIAGSGGLTQFFKHASEQHENITYLGPISHGKALSLQKKGDLIYGIYRSCLMNNVMAAPNKFYESTFLGTPVITNRGLLITEMIEKNEIGFSVDESYEDVLHFLKHIKKDEINKVGKKALLFWDLNYNDYIQNTYGKSYKSHLALLTNT